MSTKLLMGGLVLCLLVSGCASTRYAQPDPDGYAALHERLEGRRATITLLNNQSWQSRIVSVAADSVRWTNHRGGLVRAVATPEVHIIETVGKRGRSAARGLAVGAVVGGAVLAMFFNKAESEETLAGGLGYAYGGIVLGGLTAIFSTIAGAGVGTTERFVLNERSDR